MISVMLSENKLIINCLWIIICLRFFWL